MASPPSSPPSVVYTTVAEPGLVAPELASTVFVTVQSGAQADVAVQLPAPPENVPSMAGTSTSAARAGTDGLAVTTSAASATNQRI